MVDGIVHYAVDNIACAFSQTVRKGLSFYRGSLTLKETAEKHNLEYKSPEEVLNLYNGN